MSDALLALAVFLAWLVPVLVLAAGDLPGDPVDWEDETVEPPLGLDAAAPLAGTVEEDAAEAGWSSGRFCGWPSDAEELNAAVFLLLAV